MARQKFSIAQLEIILSQFNLDLKQVLPESATREEHERKYQWVEEFKLELRPKGHSDIKLRISGVYAQEYACSFKDAGGLWMPSRPTKEKFEYKKTIRHKD